MSPRPHPPGVIAPHVARSFDRQGLMKTLGATLVEADQGRCVIEAAWTPNITQQHGYFHAGCTSALADTAAGYAALSMAPAEASVLTVEFKINLLRPARGSRLRATGAVLKSGRTFMIAEAKVEVVSDSLVHCSQLLATLFLTSDRPEVGRT